MTKYTKNPFIISSLFLLFSILFLFIFFNRTSRDSLIEQIQHRQQVAVRAGAKSIESFLNSIGKSLVVLSNNPSQENLDQFVNLWSKSNITGIIFINKNGIVTRISNIKGINDVGGNVSHRDYFIWAKSAKSGEFKVFTPVVSQIGASKGRYFIPVAVPIIDSNGNFNGVLAVSILLSDLTNEYLSNLKVLDSSLVHLIANDEKIIYSDISEMIGKKLMDVFSFSFLGKAKFIEKILSEIKKDDETKLNVVIPSFSNNSVLEPYLVSAAPIHISGQIWKVVVSTPKKDLITFTYKTFNKQIIGVFVILVLFLGVTLRASRNTGYHEAVIDEHKLHKINS